VAVSFSHHYGHTGVTHLGLVEKKEKLQFGVTNLSEGSHPVQKSKPEARIGAHIKLITQCNHEP